MKDHLPIAVKRNGNAAMGYNLSVMLRDASSPGRGATGESVVVVLNEQSFLQSGTAGSAVKIHSCNTMPLPMRAGPTALRSIRPKRTVGLARPAKGSPTRGAVEP